eukprot:m.47478 g.47478  ORF g.47478 m.47478 type:complete len:245 (-) comp11921_c0_seq2:73-807(-)
MRAREGDFVVCSTTSAECARSYCRSAPAPQRGFFPRPFSEQQVFTGPFLVPACVLCFAKCVAPSIVVCLLFPVRHVTEGLTDGLPCRGFPAAVQVLVRLCNVNLANEGTGWTPLHAAVFQEHGACVLALLDGGADPMIKDAAGRAPCHIAAASDKIWGHFAVLGCTRLTKAELVERGIVSRVASQQQPQQQQHLQGGFMASFSRPDSAYAVRATDPGARGAEAGDVLGDVASGPARSVPNFRLW